uniref:UPAR/Ly6 domain-containing protein n=1 Tax=Echeneis naucrates TaxID=173247 RepID=A0A665TKG3_ECHNA
MDQKMRAAVCAIVLLLALDEGEALKCNYCFSKGGDLCTPTSTQTCSGSANACAAVIFSAPLHSSFRQCMNMAVCQGYIKTPGVFASCCTTDLCN